MAGRCLVAVLALLIAVPGQAAERGRPEPGRERSTRERSVERDQSAERERAGSPRDIRQADQAAVQRRVEATLDRIARGESDPHRNDGTTFLNRERRLPAHSENYYKEYVYREPGARSPGPERVITGRSGEVYYTPDHYETFQRYR